MEPSDGPAPAAAAAGGEQLFEFQFSGELYKVTPRWVAPPCAARARCAAWCDTACPSWAAAPAARHVTEKQSMGKTILCVEGRLLALLPEPPVALCCV